MTFSTTAQNGAIGAMVAKLNYSVDAKAALIWSFSDERTTTTKELYFHQASELIQHLKKELKIEESAKDRMTNKILSMAHEMGWELPGGKIDMKRVNSWCLKYGSFKKRLDDHNYKTELPILVTQFVNAYEYHLTSV